MGMLGSPAIGIGPTVGHAHNASAIVFQGVPNLVCKFAICGLEDALSTFARSFT